MNRKFLFTALAAGFIAAGCSDGSDNEAIENSAPPEEEAAEQEQDTENSVEDEFLVPFEGALTHVHGMGFVESEGGLYLASHMGLKIYQDGSWYETDGMFNDYMGFNAVDDGFYTSGHPGEDSDLPNPIGIQRSNDGGRSLEELGFTGETDFHLMAAGYRSHDLLVMNPQANSEMAAGFYFSENGGEDWQQLEPQGLEGDLGALAIHPDDSQLMAAASAAGIFLSKDGGASFERLTEEGEFGTAVHFTEEQLYYASYGTGASMKAYDLESGEADTFELPELNEDGAVYIAVNPSDDEEVVFNTAQGNTYFSKDGGESWEEIMSGGEVQ
ncbi:F510_1955 family glycosylhydrolase [Metaplanococcus flavidus]|uniref:F510_1955 family glycosylhydrolase n=1 Tax=Metaplanococcus flavidus TaxID=569883 RepID=A0ABW3L9S6_9BACL